MINELCYFRRKAYSWGTLYCGPSFHSYSSSSCFSLAIARWPPSPTPGLILFARSTESSAFFTPHDAWIPWPTASKYLSCVLIPRDVPQLHAPPIIRIFKEATDKVPTCLKFIDWEYQSWRWDIGPNSKWLTVYFSLFFLLRCGAPKAIVFLFECLKLHGRLNEQFFVVSMHFVSVDDHLLDDVL